jgi:CheY-like chemotaxis protein
VDTASGRGMTFEIYLPRYDRPTTNEAPAEERVRGGSERILITEDETFLAYLWEKMPQGLGYRVVSHTNGHEALEVFRASPRSFDIVITDQTMPHLTGEVVAKELLRIRPDIPIILCTGFSHTMTEEKAKAMGIRAVLTKPLGRRDLALAIRHVLDQPSA